MKLIAFLCLTTLAAAAVPSKPIAQKGEPLLADDFERADLGDWKSLIPTFTLEGGALKGVQTRADHGAVGRVYRAMKDVVVEFKFQLVGSTGFNAVFDDQKFKGSHAGHICRIAFAPTQTRLGDDKEGVMRNDIFEMRKDPAHKKEADKLLEGRGSSTTIAKLAQQKWYQVIIELKGEALRVSLDGKPVAFLKSPGIAHETKSSFHFTVNGKGVLFDDVRIWQAR
ncbi:MAG: hypothetical protein K9N47_28210 [Prosthecobacter sp.]|uniref:hypothetical protein n=1 Tax=Prosthecobacter sp. TaxID=1965333 RepID=UPI002627E85B|nr:hypothetical protein [Prosthecobacter sp.]MCF7790037.1 hypothetical protein [Prosthecobacter sp.]